MDAIFSQLIACGDANDAKRLGYATWFTTVFPSTEFDGEDRIIFEFIDYCTTLGTPARSKYWSVFAHDRLKIILLNTKIHLPGTEQLQYDVPLALETALTTTASIMQQLIDEAVETKRNPDDFTIDADTFMSRKFNERFISTITKAYQAISANKGTDSAVESASEMIDMLRIIYDKDQLEELTYDSSVEDNTKLGVVCYTGIPAIDKDMGGVRYSWLVGVEAQPGGGKTRFTLGCPVYSALTRKKNVLFFALEQSVEEIECMLVARHVVSLYNEFIDAMDIYDDKLDKQHKQMVAAARVDLFESGKYGKLRVLDDDLYIETMIQKMKYLDKLHGPFDLIVVDYMGLIEQKGGKFTKTKEDFQVIATGFRKFKNYVRRAHKAGIAISQFNEKGIDAGKQDNAITTNMAQGGITVYRNTDYNIDISCTEVMRAQFKRRFSQAKVRNSNGFEPFIALVRLGSCYFTQMKVAKV